MSLTSIISTIKRESTIAKLYKVDTQEELYTKLNDLLTKNAQLQLQGNKVIQDMALDELKRIQSALMTHKLGKVSNTDIITKYSSMISNIEKANERQQSDTDNKSSKAANMLSNMVDGFVGAVSVANPMLGLGIRLINKTMTGFIKSNITENANRKSELEERKRLLKLESDNKESLNDQIEITKADASQSLETSKLEESNIKASIVESKEKKARGRSGGRKLSPFNAEILLLNQIQTTYLKAIKDILVSNYETNEKVEDNTLRIERTMADTLDYTQSKDKTNEFKLLEYQKEMKEPSNVMGLASDKKLDNVQASGMGALELLGIMSAKDLMAKILTPIKTFLLGLPSLIKRLAKPFAAVLGVYTFLEGAFNADTILDIEKENIGLKERISAGVGNLLGDVLKFGDTILEFFGFDLIDTENIEKTIGKKTLEIFDTVVFAVVDIAETITSFISNTIEDIKTSIENVFKTIKEKIDWFNNNVSEPIANFFTIEDTQAKIAEQGMILKQLESVEKPETKQRKIMFNQEMEQFFGKPMTSYLQPTVVNNTTVNNSSQSSSMPKSSYNNESSLQDLNRYQLKNVLE